MNNRYLRRRNEKAIFEETDREYLSASQRLKIARAPRYQQFLKKYGKLPAGFWIIEGEQGVGKTSLGTALLNLDYKYHSKERNAAAQHYVDVLNEYRETPLALPEHLYFSNIKQTLTPRGNVCTHYITAEDVQLPNHFYNAQHYPFGSVIYIQEADKDFNCLESKDLNQFTYQLMKYCRHNDMTIIFDLQVFNRLACGLRELVTNRIQVQCKYDVQPFLFRRRSTVWYFVFIQSQALERCQELARTGQKVDTSFAVRYWSLRFIGDIFGHYSSRNSMFLFLYALKEYTMKGHPSLIPTEDNISLFFEESNKKPAKRAELNRGNSGGEIPAKQAAAPPRRD